MDSVGGGRTRPSSVWIDNLCSDPLPSPYDSARDTPAGSPWRHSASASSSRSDFAGFVSPRLASPSGQTSADNAFEGQSSSAADLPTARSVSTARWREERSPLTRSLSVGSDATSPATIHFASRTSRESARFRRSTLQTRGGSANNSPAMPVQALPQPGPPSPRSTHDLPPRLRNRPSALVLVPQESLCPSVEIERTPQTTSQSSGYSLPRDEAHSPTARMAQRASDHHSAVRPDSFTPTSPVDDQVHERFARSRAESEALVSMNKPWQISARGVVRTTPSAASPGASDEGLSKAGMGSKSQSEGQEGVRLAESVGRGSSRGAPHIARVAGTAYLTPWDYQEPTKGLLEMLASDPASVGRSEGALREETTPSKGGFWKLGPSSWGRNSRPKSARKSKQSGSGSESRPSSSTSTSSAFSASIFSLSGNSKSRPSSTQDAKAFMFPEPSLSRKENLPPARSQSSCAVYAIAKPQEWLPSGDKALEPTARPGPSHQRMSSSTIETLARGRGSLSQSEAHMATAPSSPLPRSPSLAKQEGSITSAERGPASVLALLGPVVPTATSFGTKPLAAPRSSSDSQARTSSTHNTSISPGTSTTSLGLRSTSSATSLPTYSTAPSPQSVLGAGIHGMSPIISSVTGKVAPHSSTEGASTVQSSRSLSTPTHWRGKNSGPASGRPESDEEKEEMDPEPEVLHSEPSDDEHPMDFLAHGSRIASSGVRGKPRSRPGSSSSTTSGHSHRLDSAGVPAWALRRPSSRPTSRDSRPATPSDAAVAVAAAAAAAMPYSAHMLPGRRDEAVKSTLSSTSLRSLGDDNVSETSLPSQRDLAASNSIPPGRASPPLSAHAAHSQPPSPAVSENSVFSMQSSRSGVPSAHSHLTQATQARPGTAPTEVMTPTFGQWTRTVDPKANTNTTGPALASLQAPHAPPAVLSRRVSSPPVSPSAAFNLASSARQPQAHSPFGATTAFSIKRSPSVASQTSQSVRSTASPKEHASPKAQHAQLPATHHHDSYFGGMKEFAAQESAPFSDLDSPRSRTVSVPAERSAQPSATHAAEGRLVPLSKAQLIALQHSRKHGLPSSSQQSPRGSISSGNTDTGLVRNALDSTPSLSTTVAKSSFFNRVKAAAANNDTAINTSNTRRPSRGVALPGSIHRSESPAASLSSYTSSQRSSPGELRGGSPFAPHMSGRASRGQPSSSRMNASAHMDHRAAEAMVYNPGYANRPNRGGAPESNDDDADRTPRKRGSGTSCRTSECGSLISMAELTKTPTMPPLANAASLPPPNFSLPSSFVNNHRRGDDQRDLADDGARGVVLRTVVKDSKPSHVEDASANDSSGRKPRPLSFRVLSSLSKKKSQNWDNLPAPPPVPASHVEPQAQSGVRANASVARPRPLTAGEGSGKKRLPNWLHS
ncbi:hypothetical protein IE81DRAFT_106064 [Ceraceosorus guamensis]|uniref:Uncharacterized protein n=1 Tax=Ceraceosorus guamensis TaxID=1522189 RepID=A0A316W2W6_9BASI|nr:hypothetical protein IE81DRAFT_106064 [Ceraceosorus guamensis]PWN42931.1 hypothetical protein IE81DRAFT_106064 [Ceraceosorus guamensis]